MGLGYLIKSFRYYAYQNLEEDGELAEAAMLSMYACRCAVAHKAVTPCSLRSRSSLDRDILFVGCAAEQEVNPGLG